MGLGVPPGGWQREGNAIKPMKLKTLMMIGGWAALGCFSSWADAAGPANSAESTVTKIRHAGRLRCGVVATPEDWNKTDLHGPLAALDVEICRAIAVAVLGPGGKTGAQVESPVFPDELTAEEALGKGGVDVLVGVTPDATSRWHWNIAFGPAIFYDGQGFLVRKDLAASSMKDLAHHTVCVVEGTDNEKELAARAKATGVALQPFDFQEEGEMDDAVATRRCDAVSAYVSHLAELRRTYATQLSKDTLLPDMLTLAPVAPAYRQDDAQWAMIVDWTIYALIQAEASGVTRANVATQRSSEDPVVQRLLGGDWSASRALGLTAKDWAAQVIAEAGNYGEIYDRTVGMGGTLGLPRGVNALWTNGGLMHPLPVQ
jgi:general L-amino acid transport system substrate-binding protein